MSVQENSVSSVKHFKNNMIRFLIDYSAAVVLLVLILYNMLFTPNFAKMATLNNIIIQMTATVLLGLGMTWVIASGGIDISVGSVMAVTSMVSVKLLGLGVFPAIVIGILVGTLSGVFVGIFISKFNIQPIIVTLPFMIGMRGLAQILNDSKVLRFQNEAYVLIGKGKIFGSVPIQVLFILAIVAVMFFITNMTVFGRKVEAVGDNQKAAMLSGINTTVIIICIYAATALLSSFAGVIETARISSSDANTIGKAMEMNAIAAVAIGGTPMTGGKPNILGTVFGAIIIQIITTMVSMNNIAFEYSLVLKAAIIIIALYVQRLLHAKKEAMVK